MYILTKGYDPIQYYCQGECEQCKTTEPNAPDPTAVSQPCALVNNKQFVTELLCNSYSTPHIHVLKLKGQNPRFMLRTYSQLRTCIIHASSEPSGYRFDIAHTNLTFKYPFMKQPSSVLFRLAKGSILDSIKILERNTPTLR